jgi:hypothetical protein
MHVDVVVMESEYVNGNLDKAIRFWETRGGAETGDFMNEGAGSPFRSHPPINYSERVNQTNAHPE